MNNIYVNFDNITGEVKPMHGVCCAPYSLNQGGEQKTIKKYFTEAKIPYCRLHD